MNRPAYSLLHAYRLVLLTVFTLAPFRLLSDLVVARYGGFDVRSNTGLLISSHNIPGAGYLPAVVRLTDGRFIAVDYSFSRYYVIERDGTMGSGKPTVSNPIAALSRPDGGFFVAGASPFIYRHTGENPPEQINTFFETLYGLAATASPNEILYSIGTLQRLNLTTKVSTFVFNNTTGIGGLEYVAGQSGFPEGTVYVCAENNGPLLLSGTFGVLGRYSSPGHNGFTDVAVTSAGTIVGCAPVSGRCVVWGPDGSVLNTFFGGNYPYGITAIPDGSGPATCANTAVGLTAVASLGTCSAVVDQTKLFNLCLGWSVSDPVPQLSATYEIGETIQNWTLSNGGQFQTLQTKVTVLDQEAPVITTPGDLTLTLKPKATSAALTYTVSGQDNCDGSLPVDCSIPSGTLLAPGQHQVGCQATDASGNVGTAQFSVQVYPAPPYIQYVQVDPNLEGANIYFTEPMPAGDIGNVTAYSVDGGVNVLDVNVLSDRVVHLKLEGVANHSSYTLSVDPEWIKISPSQQTFHVDVSLPDGEPQAGIVQRELWRNLGTWNEFEEAIRTRPSDASDLLFGFESPQGLGNQYGGRLRAHIIPTQTDVYVIRFVSDDQGKLWLSTDSDPAKKRLIAQESEWGGDRTWSLGGENSSDEFEETEWGGGDQVALTAGQSYYLEAVWLQGIGGDHAGVTIHPRGEPPPSDGTPSALTEEWLSWYPITGAAPVITKKPESVTYGRGDTITFRVKAVSETPLSYQWYLNKEPIPGANEEIFTIRDASVLDMGDYSVEVSNANGSVNTHSSDARAIWFGSLALNIEAGDFNSAGSNVPSASEFPYLGGDYFGLPGVQDIDFNGTPAKTDSAFAYGRFQPGDPWVVEIRSVPNEEVERNVGGTYVSQNYTVGWTDNNEWLNYTRHFPAGGYQIFVDASKEGMAVDGGGDPGIRLTVSMVDNPRVPDGSSEHVEGGLQGLTKIGEARSPGTVVWNSNDVLLFKTPEGTPAMVTLEGEKTIRLTWNNYGDVTRIRFVQVAPFVGDIADQSVVGDQVVSFSLVTKNNDFTVQEVRVSTDQPELFPPDQISVVAGENEGEYRVTLTPVGGVSGSAKVSVIVESDGVPVIREFHASVEDRGVKMPNLTGMSEDGAEAALAALGLRSGSIERRVSWPNDPLGVVDQSVAPGLRVQPGTPVNFTVYVVGVYTEEDVLPEFGQWVLYVRLTRPAPPEGVSVDIRTIDGVELGVGAGATAGEDFEPIPTTTLWFAPGERVVEVPIEIRSDENPEGREMWFEIPSLNGGFIPERDYLCAETFGVRLENARGAWVFGPGSENRVTALIHIRDDDHLGEDCAERREFAIRDGIGAGGRVGLDVTTLNQPSLIRLEVNGALPGSGFQVRVTDPAGTTVEVGQSPYILFRGSDGGSFASPNGTWMIENVGPDVSEVKLEFWESHQQEVLITGISKESRFQGNFVVVQNPNLEWKLNKIQGVGPGEVKIQWSVVNKESRPLILPQVWLGAPPGVGSVKGAELTSDGRIHVIPSASLFPGQSCDGEFRIYVSLVGPLRWKVRLDQMLKPVGSDAIRLDGVTVEDRHWIHVTSLGTAPVDGAVIHVSDSADPNQIWGSGPVKPYAGDPKSGDVEVSASRWFEWENIEDILEAKVEVWEGGGNPSAVIVPAWTPPDANGDGVIDSRDLIGSLGSLTGTNTFGLGDLNGDGKIDSSDLAEFSHGFMPPR